VVGSGGTPMRKQHGTYLRQKGIKASVLGKTGIIGIKALDFKEIATVITRSERT
jgi:hypothetical protein